MTQDRLEVNEITVNEMGLLNIKCNQKTILELICFSTWILSFAVSLGEFLDFLNTDDSTGLSSRNVLQLFFFSAFLINVKAKANKLFQNRFHNILVIS